MRHLIITALALSLALIYAAFSSADDAPFALADDMPRGALIYAEAADLLSLIERWESSEFKDRYLSSQSFEELGRRHLGLKLASRWQEFSEAAGIPIDLAMIAGFGNKRAAVALYDIGKLEFVFVAPLSAQAFEGIRLLQAGNRFSWEERAGGFYAFRVPVEADSGRQKQELLFTYHEGRFVLATSENLLVRTLANIDGKPGKDRLSDTTSFRLLAGQAPRGELTVWADQAALRSDYYFKRYWLLPDEGSLADIRAGIFVFSAEESALVERRIFLPEAGVTVKIPMADRISEMLRYLPPDSPFYRLRSADVTAVAKEIGRSIRFSKDEPTKRKRNRPNLYPEFTIYRPEYHYDGYYDRDFDTKIDQDEDTTQPPPRVVSLGVISSALKNALPSAVLSVYRTRSLPEPMFVEFDRGAAVRLRSPGGLDRVRLEAAIGGVLAEETMIKGSLLELEWAESESCSGVRVAKRPMIGWEAAYAIYGSDLLIGNNVGLVCEMLEASFKAADGQRSEQLSELAVIDVGQTTETFRRVFAKLRPDHGREDLFTGNISGMIDVVGAKRVEFRRSSVRGLISEELRLIMR